MSHATMMLRYGATGAFFPSMVLLCLAAFFIFGCALFWSIPPTYLSKEAAAIGIAVISSIGIFGGFFSPTLIGWIKTDAGSLDPGPAGDDGSDLPGRSNGAVRVTQGGLAGGHRPR